MFHFFLPDLPFFSLPSSAPGKKPASVSASLAAWKGRSSRTGQCQCGRGVRFLLSRTDLIDCAWREGQVSDSPRACVRKQLCVRRERERRTAQAPGWPRARTQFEPVRAEVDAAVPPRHDDHHVRHVLYAARHRRGGGRERGGRQSHKSLVKRSRYHFFSPPPHPTRGRSFPCLECPYVRGA